MRHMKLTAVFFGERRNELELISFTLTTAMVEVNNAIPSGYVEIYCECSDRPYKVAHRSEGKWRYVPEITPAIALMDTTKDRLTNQARMFREIVEREQELCLDLNYTTRAHQLGDIADCLQGLEEMAGKLQYVYEMFEEAKED